MDNKLIFKNITPFCLDISQTLAMKNCCLHLNATSNIPFIGFVYAVGKGRQVDYAVIEGKPYS